MKPLQRIAGIFLGATGALFVVGSFAHVVAPDPDVPLWMAVGTFLLLGLLPSCGAFLLLRRSMTVNEKACPACGSGEREAAGVVRQHHNPWIFHFGGWLFASLWGASREQQVRCANCDNLYFTSTKGSQIAGVLLWVFLLYLVLAIGLAYLFRPAGE